MKSILLYSHDPGGANAIIPISTALGQQGYSVNLYGDGSAGNRYRDAGLSWKSLHAILGEVSKKSILQFIMDTRPDFIITATSAEDFTEKYLWVAATELGITSFAVLDQWINYGIRFSSWGLSGFDQYLRTPTHSYLPSRIIVMDEFAKSEMIDQNIIEPDRILPLGQPYFESLLLNIQKMASRTGTRELLGVSLNSYLIVFVSEPITLDYGLTRTERGYLGYNEYTVFSDLIHALDVVSYLVCNEIHLVIKIHPRENSNVYDDLVKHANLNFKISINYTTPPIELIDSADLVCGMSSMMLLESVILKKPVVSIMIGLCVDNPFILERRGLLDSIRDKSALVKTLKDQVCNINTNSYTMDLPANVVKSIISTMEGML